MQLSAMRPKMEGEGGKNVPHSQRPRLPPIPQEATTRAASERGSGKIWVTTAAPRLMAISKSHDVHLIIPTTRYAMSTQG